MIKLLVTAITWLFVSNGMVGVPTWLVSPETTTTEPAKVATDSYCRQGNWPDRTRACATGSRIPTLKSNPQTIETAADLDRIAPHIAAPLAAPARTSVRFYDASSVADRPVTAIPAAAEIPTPVPAPRFTQVEEPAGGVTQPRAERTSPAASRTRATLYRPAHARRTSAGHRRMADNCPRRPLMTRVYGMAF
jgi:hypothetical protein